MSKLILNDEDIKKALVEYYRTYEDEVFKAFNFEDIQIRAELEIVVEER